MYCIYERIGTTRLTLVDLSTPGTTGDYQPASIRLGSGGGYRVYGTRQAPRDAFDLTISGKLTGADESSIEAQVAEILNYGRKRVQLWRRSLATGQTSWAYVEITRIGYDPDPRMPLLLPITIGVHMWSPYWYGDRHSTGWKIGDTGIVIGGGRVLGDSSTLTMSSNPYNFALSNGGNIDVMDGKVTVTAVGSNITSFTLRNLTAGVESEWTYTGTITAGQSLIVDWASQGVTNNGVADYAHFDLTSSNHLIDEWLRLAPGSNSLRATFTGGGAASTILIDFSDGYVG